MKGRCCIPRVSQHKQSTICIYYTKLENNILSAVVWQQSIFKKSPNFLLSPGVVMRLEMLTYGSATFREKAEQDMNIANTAVEHIYIVKLFSAFNLMLKTKTVTC